MTDQEIIKNYLEPHYRDIINVAMSKTEGDYDVAQDLAHEAYLTAFGLLDKFRKNCKAYKDKTAYGKIFLLSMLKYGTLDHWRQSAKEAYSYSGMIERYIPNESLTQLPESSGTYKGTIQQALKYVQRLREPGRTIYMYHLEGKTNKEISQLFSGSIGVDKIAEKIRSCTSTLTRMGKRDAQQR